MHFIIVNINIEISPVSNLVPLIFLVGINDMEISSQLLKFIHFADVTTVYLANGNLDKLYYSLNDENFAKLVNDFMSIKTFFNVEKTCYMIISNRLKD